VLDHALLEAVHKHDIPMLLISQCTDKLLSSQIFKAGATVDKMTYALLCKYLMAILNIFVTGMISCENWNDDFWIVLL
jgi:hypothetical protein